MDGLAVYWIAQVVEQVDHTMSLHHYIEEDANCVKLKVNLLSIGVKAGSLDPIDVTNMTERW